MGFELPVSLGSIAILVFVFNADLQTVYWGQAVASIVEVAVVLAILQRSNWALYAKEAQQRQGAGKEASDDQSGPAEEEEGRAPGHASLISLQERKGASKG